MFKITLLKSMKKSLFVLSLLLPLTGFAQGVDTVEVWRFMENPLGLGSSPSPWRMVRSTKGSLCCRLFCLYL